MLNSIHEECGVFGIYSKRTGKIADSVYMGLYALQHRGQESCGIVVNNDGVFSHHKDLGLVQEVFHKETLEALGEGNIAIGHVRYSTTGSLNRVNAQPLCVRHIKGPMATAHNGNLVNAYELRHELELSGVIFQTTNDTEVISYLVTRNRLSQPSIEKAIEQTMYSLKGAYSLLIMSPQKLIAVRDPNGFRPLCMGRTADGDIVFASETCALDIVGAELIRELDAGEIVVIDKNGERSIRTHCGHERGLCVFEYVYFARPDSVIEGVSVHGARLHAGELLWREHPVDADVVIGVPDSGLDAALGLSQASGIPYGIGFIKNRYVGRSFIQPTQSERVSAVKIKLNVLKETVAGKRVIMVDDSIVRGTTSARIIRLIKEAGAKEVHLRISCPPFISPCHFGTDIDSKENLIACKMTQEEIRKMIGADTLGYLSVMGVREIAKGAGCELCTGCFTGKYPIDAPNEIPKDKFEQRIGASE